METNNRFADAYATMERWLAQPGLQPKLRRELEELERRIVAHSGDKEAREEILDRFYRELEFGTGGLRGVLGAGSNRMNIYTVRRVTQGFANYLAGLDPAGTERAVAVAYDSRIQSHRFALEAGAVLAANGFAVYLFPELMPTPVLSFAVRHYRCLGGVMITASHNPAKYNGYKVYNRDGCQANLDEAASILDHIEQVDFFDGVQTQDVDWERYMDGALPEAGAAFRMIPEEVTEAYYTAVKNLRAGIDCSDLEVVYTPLNGTGNKPVRRILADIGVDQVHVVPEQELPDGNFPTCPYPNPEKEEALRKGLDLCRALGTPDLLLATDPDCDRLGIAVRQADPDTGAVSYRLLTGNEIGIVLLDFLCANRPLPKHPIAMKTIVSSKLAEKVAAHYGVESRDVLTGFKFIGEQIGLLEQEGHEGRFLFGFEESYGFLSGTHVRDKDAVNAAMLVCEAAALEKSRGLTLADRIDAIYRNFGYYKNDLMEMAFEGPAGMEEMDGIMAALRAQPPKEIGGRRVVEVADYKTSQRRVLGNTSAMAAGYRPIKLPKSDVIEYMLADGSSVIVRPSGTEPKLKIYLSAKGDTEAAALTAIGDLRAGLGGFSG